MNRSIALYAQKRKGYVLGHSVLCPSEWDADGQEMEACRNVSKAVDVRREFGTPLQCRSSCHKMTDGSCVPADIYDALGVKYLPPWERNGFMVTELVKSHEMEST